MIEGAGHHGGQVMVAAHASEAMAKFRHGSWGNELIASRPPWKFQVLMLQRDFQKGDPWGWYERWAYSMVRWCLHAVVIACRESGCFTEIEREFPHTAVRSLDEQLPRVSLNCSGVAWITCSQARIRRERPRIRSGPQVRSEICFDDGHPTSMFADRDG